MTYPEEHPQLQDWRDQEPELLPAPKLYQFCDRTMYVAALERLANIPSNLQGYNKDKSCHKSP